MFKLATQFVKSANKDETMADKVPLGIYTSISIFLILKPNKLRSGRLGGKGDAAIAVRTRPRLLEAEGIAQEPVRRPILLLTPLGAIACVTTVCALVGAELVACEA
jgi:hypothetical protein